MKKTLYDLSNPQKSIWYTEQFYQNTNINSLCGTAIISNTLNFDLLKRAINIVVKNNDSFRIRFVKDNNNWKQYIDNFSELDIEILNIKDKNEIFDIENKVMQKKFNFSEELLFEFKIFKFENNTGGFLLNIHHFISDGWSLGLICRKVMETYEKLLSKINSTNSEELSYISYLENEKLYIDSPKFQNDKQYWDSVFESLPEIATLPSETSNLNIDLSCLGQNTSFLINKNKLKSISEYCKNNNVSVYNFFISVYSVYIYRITNLNNFVIGTPILNRTNFKEKNTIGMFSNIMPLYINLNSSINFTEFIKSISDSTFSLLRHQKYPYQCILEDIRKKDPTIPNLYNIMISYQTTRTNTESNLNYNTEWVFNGLSANDLDIQLYDLNQNGTLTIKYIYKKLKYSSTYITSMHNRILEIIDQILENNDICIDEFNIITKNEEKLLLQDFNNSNIKYDKTKTVINLFEKIIEDTPDKTAIICNNKELSYKELNSKANLLARFLISKGAKQKDIIAICLNRSIEMAVGLLAISKIGATYLPIDPDYPIDRINYMLEDSDCKLILTTKDISSLIGTNIHKIDINLDTDIYTTNNLHNLNLDLNPENLIYLIYTSGSTGKPKGVMVKHININNFLVGLKEIIDFKDKVMVSVTTICFDIFVLEFFRKPYFRYNFSFSK